MYGLIFARDNNHNMSLYISANGTEEDLSLPDFDSFYNRYWKLLYTTALTKTGDHADSVDIVQELFIHLWENRATIRIKESTEGYLLTSLRNRILNHYRRCGVREKVWQDYARFVEALVSNNAFNEQERFSEAAEEMVQKAVGRLPEKMRYIFVQNKYHQKNIQQLAEELDLSPQTIKNQLTKALHQLERLLRQHHAREITLFFILFVSQEKL